MKNILLAIALPVSLGATAQISKVTLQASGLTCSMCSNSINKSLRSVDYVEKVMANIKNSSFEITFKPNAKVNFDQLKKKVEEAGFSVAKFSAIVNFDNKAIENDSHLSVNGTTFHFIDIKNQTLSGEKTIRVLDKGFVPARDFKKNHSLTKMECYKTGVAGKCCIKDGLAPGTRIIHVTI